MTKVLFLDADGVINNRKTSNTDGWPIDKYMAFLVGRIVERTGCKIVLSSTWRLWPEGRSAIRRRVMPFIDVTPSLPFTQPLPRGREIKVWLEANPDVERYAILDDENDMLHEQMPNFFKTSFEIGLTEEIAEAVEKHLLNKKGNYIQSYPKTQ